MPPRQGHRPKLRTNRPNRGTRSIMNLLRQNPRWREACPPKIESHKITSRPDGLSAPDIWLVCVLPCPGSSPFPAPPIRPPQPPTPPPTPRPPPTPPSPESPKTRGLGPPPHKKRASHYRHLLCLKPLGGPPVFPSTTSVPAFFPAVLPKLSRCLRSRPRRSPLHIVSTAQRPPCADGPPGPAPGPVTNAPQYIATSPAWDPHAGDLIAKPVFPPSLVCFFFFFPVWFFFLFGSLLFFFSFWCFFFGFFLCFFFCFFFLFLFVFFFFLLFCCCFFFFSPLFSFVLFFLFVSLFFFFFFFRRRCLPGIGTPSATAGPAPLLYGDVGHCAIRARGVDRQGKPHL